MNLALHGLLLQVILSILQFRHGFRLCSAGEPGYLDFDNLPETNFSCQGKVIGGYYADIEAGCQMFHVCTIGQKDEIMDIKFLCLNGTVFDQETRVCERVDEVDCSKSERFYNLNLELYGNNAVTLSLHEGEIDDEEPPVLIEDHQGTTSTRPSTMSTTTTTQRPSISSTTAASGPFQHPNGYPQHYQPQPPFPSIQTSQSKSLYDDKNGGFHRQYIYHIDNHNEQTDINANNNDNRATSYQLFSNQGASSTTGAPQVHQIHYSSTSNSQVNIGNDPSSVSPLFHTTSSTIQSLLAGNGNNPTLINPIYHNNGIASTTEFTVHSNAARDTSDYQQNGNQENRHRIDNNQEERRFLEPIQSTNQGKISKLTISPVPSQREVERMKQQLKSTQTVSQSQSTLQQQHRIPTSFLTIAPMNNGPPAVRSFYPTPKTSSKTQSSSTHITQHIHVPSIPSVPQLKPHQVTINLPPPDIQRIVQNPSPLLPSQSRVIVTAKASVSDESGRPLNTSQLVTLPTVPASYDDYKEGDESFDPFYRDVPKIRNVRGSLQEILYFLGESRKKRSIEDENTPINNNKNISVEKEKEIISVEDTKTINSDEHSEDTSNINEEDEKVEYDEQETSTDKASSVEEKDISGSLEFESNEKTLDYPADSQEYINEDEYGSLEDYSEEVIPEFTDFNSTDEKELEHSSDLPSIDDHSSSVTPSFITTTENPEPFPTPTSTTTSSETKDLQIDRRDEQPEGVLKFTDEIPNSEEEIIESQKNDDASSKSFLNPLDYVDDNYEPEHYHENESPPRPLTDKAENENVQADEKLKTNDEVTTNINDSSLSPMTTISSTSPSTTTSTTASTTSTTTSTEMTTILTTSTTPSTTVTSMTPPSTTISTTPYTTTTSTMPPTTTTSTMSPTTTTSTMPPTTTSTTVKTPAATFRSFTTTTVSTRHKPTPFNLFKTVTTRKSYVYIPPTTTPMPVIIKTRLPLLNPKPAKPPRSYNEIAPKPVIRKVPLLGRRGLTTTTNRNDLENVESTTVSTTDRNLPNNELPETTTSEASTLQTVSQITELTTIFSTDMIDITTKMEQISNNPEVVDENAEIIKESTSEGLKNDEVTVPSLGITTKVDDITTSTLRSIKPLNKKSVAVRRGAFSCLDVEMYRFYADKRDCRLFHYCSPGFTAKQVLDFRFVCEEGTSFNEESQSCVHQEQNADCQKKVW